MDEKLKNLKQAMKNHTFKQVQFTDQHRTHVMQAIQQTEITIDMILPLITDKRTGYELVQLLYVKGIAFKEGSVYTLLHQLEQQGLILAEWLEDGQKYYHLTTKGKRALQKQTKSEKNKYSLKNLLQEVRFYENT